MNWNAVSVDAKGNQSGQEFGPAGPANTQVETQGSMRSDRHWPQGPPVWLEGATQSLSLTLMFLLADTKMMQKNKTEKLLRKLWHFST